MRVPEELQNKVKCFHLSERSIDTELSKSPLPHLGLPALRVLKSIPENVYRCAGCFRDLVRCSPQSWTGERVAGGAGVEVEENSRVSPLVQAGTSNTTRGSD